MRYKVSRTRTGEHRAISVQEDDDTAIEASNWLEALQKQKEALGLPTELQQFTFKLQADGVSARVEDAHNGCTWLVEATFPEAEEEPLRWEHLRQSVYLLKPFWWLFLLVALVVGVPAYYGLKLLALPQGASRGFAIAWGLQASLWVWATIAAGWGVNDQVERMHWRRQELFRQGLLSAGLALLGLFVFWLFQSRHLSIWWLTGIALLGLAFLLHCLYKWLTVGLLRATEQGWLDHHQVSRWMGVSASSLVACLLLVMMGLGNFIAGMHWWYRSYVTDEKRKVVLARAEQLRSLQANTLYDTNQKDLGLLAKTASDWNRIYNDPSLLRWKLSEAIERAEGAVPPAAWWWGYLPSGHKLLSEPFSLKAFLRMPYYFLKQRRKVGGSTPALQAAKNFMDFGLKRQSKGLMGTIGIKLFDEIPRSYIMAQHFTPREMMANYMATVWSGYGHHYGLHRMSLYCFDQPDLRKLTWNQAVVLASSLPNPGRFNPWFLKGCRKGRCRSKRRGKVYEVWLERIKQLKASLRRRGHKIPKALPPFRNGIHRLRTLSFKWTKHDAHIRRWVKKEWSQLPQHTKSSSITLSYDRSLVLGKEGLVTQLSPKLTEYRSKLKELQAAFTLVDTKTGQIKAQYGGDHHVDMALSHKPVVGSTFKVMTSLVAAYWPKWLPLLNQGRNPKKPNRKKFLYQAQDGAEGFYVRNSHLMPKFVNTHNALVMSANIGFVFLSLRWTWLLDQETSEKVVRIGLQEMMKDRLKLSAKEAKERVAAAMKDPTLLLKVLRERLGYSAYLKRWRTWGLFEAAKSAAIREQLQRRRLSPAVITTFLDANSPHDYGFGGYLQGRWAAHRGSIAARWKEQPSWERITWVRPLRMELGLRYIIYLAKKITGLDPKDSYLKPVLTMTLGVHNATTQELAALVATVAAGQIRHPKMIASLNRGNKTIYHATPSTQPPAIPQEGIVRLRQAMNATLRWGTAARAGRLVQQQHGSKWLAQAGAKTGTVQRSRGVSCIGYMGQYAGALTLSTPNNNPLIKYTLHDGFTNQLKSLEKQLKEWQACLKKAKEDSPRHRLCTKKEAYWRKRLEAYKEKLEGYEERARRFLRMGSKWKASKLKAGRAKQKAKAWAQRASRKRRQIAVYEVYVKGDQRMITRYDKWFSRFDQRMSKNLKDAKARKKKIQAKYDAAKQRLKQAQSAFKSSQQEYLAFRKENKRTRAWQRERGRKLRVLLRWRDKRRKATYWHKVYKTRLKGAKKQVALYTKLLRDKIPMYHTNKKKQAHNRARLRKWRKLQKETAQEAKGFDAKQAEATQEEREWLRLAAKQEAQYNRIHAAVRGTHRKYEIYSSEACWLLFSLLSHWKKYEDKKQTPTQAQLQPPKSKQEPKKI